MPTFIVQHKPDGKLRLIHKRADGTEGDVIDDADEEMVTEVVNQLNDALKESTIVYHEYPAVKKEG